MDAPATYCGSSPLIPTSTKLNRDSSLGENVAKLKTMDQSTIAALHFVTLATGLDPFACRRLWVEFRFLHDSISPSLGCGLSSRRHAISRPSSLPNFFFKCVITFMARFASDSGQVWYSTRLPLSLRTWRSRCGDQIKIPSRNCSFEKE